MFTTHKHHVTTSLGLTAPSLTRRFSGTTATGAEAGTGAAGAAGAGTAPAAGGTGGATTTPAAGTGTPAAKGGDDDLGAGGIAALRAEREARAAAERERDAARQEAEDLRAKHQTAEEKAIADAKKEGATEATLAANRRIVKSEVRAAAGGKLADPKDAEGLLGDLDRFIVKGEVDEKAISSAIDDLVKTKPYLAANGAGKARSLPGGSATQNSGSSFNDTLREKMRGRQ